MCTPTFEDAQRLTAQVTSARQAPREAEDEPAPSGRLTLEPVDAVEVTVVVDNFVDVLLADAPGVRRVTRPWDFFDREQLRAEHGYSLLVTVEKSGWRQSLLYDAGVGRETALHNLDVLGVRPNDLRAIVLSHGHTDHHGGLAGLVGRVGLRGLPLVLHPDAWRDRKVVFPNGDEVHLPPPSRSDLDREGIAVTDERGPSLLLDGSVLITGQVPRTTEFEQGMPIQQARVDGGWEPDPWIWDDQAVVIHVQGQGLVVLSSCSHSGVINVLRQARRLTGIDRVRAFAGGMHLSGGLFEKIIPPTLDELVEIGPQTIVAGHCTGWKATHEIARRLPDAFVQTSVGTSLRFAAQNGESGATSGGAP